MDSFQAGQAGAFLSSAGGRFALLSQPGPEGAAPSRQPWVRQPGRCGASRCLTGSSYSWKARYHGLSHQPAGPCHPASAMSPGAGDDSSAEGALVSRGRGFPAYLVPRPEAGPFTPVSFPGTRSWPSSRGRLSRQCQTPGQKPSASPPLLPTSCCRFILFSQCTRLECFGVSWGFCFGLFSFLFEYEQSEK